MARSAAKDEFGDESEVFSEVLRLLHEFADHPISMTTALRTEIARLSLYLENVRVDGK